MDIFTLDDQLRRYEVFDAYKSLIWVERNRGPGEFELYTMNTKAARDILQKGRHITIRGSKYVMVVETHTYIAGSEERLLKIYGRGYEKIFEDRVVASSLGATEDATGKEVLWTFTAEGSQAIRDIVRKATTLKPADTITYLQPIVDVTEGTIEEDDAGSYSIRPSSLFDAVNEIAEVYRLGWGIERPADEPELFFKVTTGVDRTTGQATVPPVVFSEELGNLTDISTVESDRGYKNVAYVFGKRGAIEVTRPDENPAVTGLDRRVVFVVADDIDDSVATGAPYNAELTRRGLVELAKHKPVMAFEGEARESSTYVYGLDYNLGDLIEHRDEFGNRNYMVVSEQTLVVDAEGIRSYPSLTYYKQAVVGTWDAYNPTQNWDDVPNDTAHEWDDLP